MARGVMRAVAVEGPAIRLRRNQMLRLQPCRKPGCPPFRASAHMLRSMGKQRLSVGVQCKVQLVDFHEIRIERLPQHMSESIQLFV